MSHDCDEGCVGARCSCVIQGGAGMDVSGAGTNNSPFVVTALGGDEYQSVPAGVLTMHAGAQPSVSTQSEVPAGWLLCDGKAHSRTAYPALYAAIGSEYGSGDGATTFNVPNMVVKMPMGSDALYTISTGGSFTSTLIGNQLPAHTHTITHGHGGTLGSGWVSSDHGHGEGFTDGGTSNHNHAIVQSSTLQGAPGSGAADRVGAAAGVTGSGGFHNHSISTGYNDQPHTHNLFIPDFTSPTLNGPGASATSNITNPYFALAFIIKT